MNATGFIIRALTVILVVFLRQSSFPFVPKIIFLDVGQGDATLIMPEEGVQILIDGGPGDFVLEKLGKYMPPWDRKIEVLILTHPHLDHMEGLIDVLNRYEVGETIYYPLCFDSKTYQIFKDLADSDFEPYGRGNQIDIGRDSQYMLSIIYPQSLSNSECYNVSNLNNGSVVSYFRYNDLEVLLMGDAEKEEEELLLQNNLLKTADILKAGHHCSRTSSSDLLLDTVSPKLAICSSGKDNSYGHPHYETLKKFEERGIKYRITAEEGNIIINL
jgi:competence protein ComEC